MVWALAALPVSSVLEREHQRIPVGGKGRGFLAHSQSSGGIVRRPLPTKMGSRFPLFIPGHQRLSCLYQVINVFLFIPGHQRLLVYTRSSTSYCLYQVINGFLFIPGHCLLVYTRSSSDSLFIPGHPAIPCSYQGKRAIHTSGRGVVSASWAGTMPTSGPWAACVSGAWTSSIHSYGRALGGE